MKVIVGLGNKGNEYQNTRHNIGFEVIRCLAERHQIAMTTKKHKGLIGQGHIEGQKVVLVMPLTYMNLSGECVRELMDYYKIDQEEIVVIYDDLSLDVGSLRVRDKGSAGGHNGIKSIIAHLHSEEFLRFKVGIGPQPRGLKAEKFVLDTFRKEEVEAVKESIEHTAKAIEALLKHDLTYVMNNYTKKV